MRKVAIETYEGGVGELRSHPLEGEAYDAGRVEAYAKLKEQERLAGCLVDEVVEAFGLPVPVTVLYEGIVTTEIHADGCSILIADMLLR